MKRVLTIAFILFTLFALSTTNAQCKKDAKYLEFRKKAGFSGDNPNLQASYYACMRYYLYACIAKNDMDVVNGKAYPRTQQSAYSLEDKVNEILANYNSRSEKGCGDLKPIKFSYTDSIGPKKDPIVGYWITKDIISGKTYYPQYTFFNDGSFKLSYYASDKQKSTWKKVNDTTYEITEVVYNNFDKKFEDPKVSKFIVSPNGTATFYSVNYRGESVESQWYYKGKAYHLFGLSESEKLQPKPL